ncbi:ATP-binding cassette subfamily B protein [Aminobacter aganoensis]|uniref:ATP-binding cassette subfamily B protein n=2 Tax=Aminobacter aganoensis TaxID=83264 RepID=A0A7X0KLR6_9HYPH|nr:ATP-binding cassette subfamily B protein [Aminobacter aganoensis]
MTTAQMEKAKASRSEIVGVIRRVAAENGRAYAWQYGLAALFLLIIAGSTAFTAWVMRDVIDEIFYRQRADLIALISLAILASFALRGVATYGQAVILAKIGNNLVARYQRRIFDHLMKLGMDFFSAQRSSQLVAQINQNVGGVRDLLNITVTSIARDAVSLVALVGVMVYQDPVLSMIAFLIGPPLVLLVSHLMRRLRRLNRDAILVNSRLFGAVQEAVQGIAIVKAFTMEDQLSKQMDTLVNDVEARSNKIARVSERLSPISETLAGVVVAAVIAYAGYRSTMGAQPPGAVFSFITALLLAYDPARRLARTQVGLERALVNARMIYEILDTEPRQEDASDAGAIKVGKGDIRFEAVSFSYGPDVPVLHDLSFTAPGGKTTAIVGASGAGKSTLVALLQRFYDVDGGHIEIDGQDIAHVTKRSLRQSIAYVSQHPYLFEGTIRDNIRYGRADATNDKVQLAAEQAFADEFIRQQPDGYDTPIGEGGATLSGGQRQRISIARALVRSAPILLLDEATSALDNESEARVQQALAAATQGRTTIVIAHRLSTVVSADHIVVLEQGRLVEQGTHAGLMSDPNSVYARFHNLHDEASLGLVDDTGETTKEEAQRAGAAAGSLR